MIWYHIYGTVLVLQYWYILSMKNRRRNTGFESFLSRIIAHEYIVLLSTATAARQAIVKVLDPALATRIIVIYSSTHIDDMARSL